MSDATFNNYINKVLKSTHKTMGMTGDCRAAMNNLVHIILRKLLDNVSLVIESTSGKKTITHEEIHTAIRQTLPSEMYAKVIKQVKLAEKKYVKSKDDRKENRRDAENGSKSAPMQRSASAGLVFPITRIEKIMMNTVAFAKRKSETAAVGLSATVEYIITQIVADAGNFAAENNRTRIKTEHVTFAISSNSGLETLFKRTVLGPISVTSFEKNSTNGDKNRNR